MIASRSTTELTSRGTGTKTPATTPLTFIIPAIALGACLVMLSGMDF